MSNNKTTIDMNKNEMIMKRREKVIDIMTDITEKLHRNDEEFINLVYNWTVKLELMEPDDELFRGLLGFYDYAKNHGISDHDILETFLHDICGSVRQEECFDPRSSSYINNYSDLLIA